MLEHYAEVSEGKKAKFASKAISLATGLSQLQIKVELCFFGSCERSLRALSGFSFWLLGEVLLSNHRFQKFKNE